MNEKQKRNLELIKLYRSKDKEVRDQVIIDILEENEGLINNVIRSRYSTFVPQHYEDMYSAGKVALICSLPNYDEERSSLSTYLTNCINHEIYEYISKFVQNLPTHQAYQVNKIKKVKQELIHETGHEPSDYDVALRAKVSLRTVRKANELMGRENISSLDDENLAEKDFISHALSPEDIYLQKERFEELYKSIDNVLDEEEKLILLKKFGLCDTDAMRNEDIFKETGIATTDIRKIMNKALRKMRNDLDKKDRHKFKVEISFTPEDLAIKQMDELEGIDLDADDSEDGYISD